MKRRICWIIPTLDRGGAEKQLFLLARGINRSKFDPHVLVLTRTGPMEQQYADAGIPYTIIGKRGKFDPFAISKLVRKLRALKPDIVHTWLFAANSYGRFAALRANVPVIIGGERCVDPWKTAVHHFIDRWLAKRTRGLITNSHGVVEFYAQHGIDPKQFRVIPNAVEPLSHVPNEEDRKKLAGQLRSDLGLPEDAIVIGAIGRLWRQKGYKDLLWSAELLRVVRDDSYLLVIGEGPERERLEHYRDQIGLGNRVRFLGHRNDVQRLLPGMDLIWNGSLYEGQSNSLLEAMQFGLPIVATDIPGNRDLVVPGETGFLYDIGDVAQLARHTQNILSDSALRQRLSNAAQQRIAEHFSLERMIKTHETLYQEWCES